MPIISLCELHLKATQKSQPAGFEPAHAKHTRLAGEPRNHLGTAAVGKTEFLFIAALISILVTVVLAKKKKKIRENL